MSVAKSPFTYTRYVTLDDEGNAAEAAESHDEDGNLLEGVHPEHINVKPGDELDLSDEERAGLAGFLQEEDAPAEADDSEPEQEETNEN
jgi:hypothetical protein